MSIYEEIIYPHILKKKKSFTVTFKRVLEIFLHCRSIAFFNSENVEFSKLFRRIATAGDFEDFDGYIDKTLSRCQFSSTHGNFTLTRHL